MIVIDFDTEFAFLAHFARVECLLPIILGSEVNDTHSGPCLKDTVLLAIGRQVQRLSVDQHVVGNSAASATFFD